MASVFWIASYPRSGNTWVRFLLTSLLRGPVVHSDEVARFVQDIHIHDTVSLDAAADPKLLKTHWRYHASFPFAGQTGGAVYIVRHPAAVLESALNFYFLQAGGPIEPVARADIARDWIGRFIRCGGRRAWIEGGAGTWAENVLSWTGDLPFPSLTIRYEDLRAAPVSQLRHLCGLLGVEKTESELCRAVADVTVERMAEMEEAELASPRVGLFNNEALKGRDHGFRQVRSSRQNRIEISADERRHVVALNQAVCDRLGYTAAI